MNDAFHIQGRVHLELRGPDGALKAVRDVENLVVNAGLYHIADQLAGQAQAAMSHMAVGNDDDPAPAAGDVALNGELARVALTGKTQGSGVDANKVSYVATFGAGTGTGALVEAGIFNDASAGSMLCRSIFAVINKGAADALTITWVLTISAA
jgi:hypothetical protein